MWWGWFSKLHVPQCLGALALGAHVGPREDIDLSAEGGARGGVELCEGAWLPTANVDLKHARLDAHSAVVHLVGGVRGVVHDGVEAGRDSQPVAAKQGVR